MRLLTHSTRARNSIWIFPVISEACRGLQKGEGEEVWDNELPPATTNKRYRHLTDCSNSWFCEKLTKHARTSTRTSVRMRTLIQSLALSLRWRNDGGNGALLFVILELQISLYSTINLAHFHAGKTKDLGNKLAPLGLGAGLKATAELHPFLGSVASILSRQGRLIFAVNMHCTAPRPLSLSPSLSRSLALSLSLSLSFFVCDHTDSSCDKFSARGQTNSNSMPPSAQEFKCAFVCSPFPLHSVSLPSGCPPVRKAFKCLGVVAAYAVSVCLSVPLPFPRPAFDWHLHLWEPINRSGKIVASFWSFRVDCEKMSPNFPLSLIN